MKPVQLVPNILVQKATVLYYEDYYYCYFTWFFLKCCYTATILNKYLNTLGNKESGFLLYIEVYTC